MMWTKRLTREQTSLAVVTLLAGALRFAWVGKDCLWLDEFNWLNWSTTPDILAAAPPMFPHSPFFALLMRPFAFLFESDFGLRLFPAAIGMAAVPLMYVLGKSLFNPGIGRTAAFLVAVCPIHVIYSRQYLPYTLLFLSVSLYAWLAYQSVGGKSNWLLAGVTLSVAASLYTHVYSIFSIGMVFFAIGAHLLLCSRNFPKFLKLSGAHFIGLLLYVPWGNYISLTKQTPIEAGAPSTESALYVFQSMMSSLWRGDQKADDLLTWPLLLLVLFLLLGSLACLKKHLLPFFIVLSWSVSWLGVFLVSRWVHYLFDGRYALGALPGLILLVAVGVCGLQSLTSELLPPFAKKRRWVPIVGRVIPAVLLAWNAGVLVHYYSAGPLEEYQPVLSWLALNAGREDTLITSIGRGKMICQRYSSDLAARMEDADPSNLLENVQDHLEKGERVWCLCRWAVPKPLQDWLDASKTPNVQMGGDVIFVCLLRPGLQQSQEGLDQLAREFLEGALKTFANHPTSILTKLGRLASKDSGGGPHARQYFEAAIRENEWRLWFAPTSYELHRLLADCHFAIEHFSEAGREYEAAERLVGGSRKTTSAELAQIAKIKEAEELQKAGRYLAAAEVYLDLYASSEPKEPYWWVMAAMMEAKQGNHPKSLALFSAIEKVHPESWYAASMHGEILLLDNRLDEAREAFGRASNINGADGHSLIRLGDIARAKRDRSAALGYYEKALALGGAFREEALTALRAMKQPQEKSDR
jgi:tetratricopeptide (TPR) repeat protein/4-amino-4-deoxy-L-arabinose transferase-like glycosyltransferase